MLLSEPRAQLRELLNVCIEMVLSEVLQDRQEEMEHPIEIIRHRITVEVAELTQVAR